MQFTKAAKIPKRTTQYSRMHFLCGRCIKAADTHNLQAGSMLGRRVDYASHEELFELDIFDGRRTKVVDSHWLPLIWVTTRAVWWWQFIKQCYLAFPLGSVSKKWWWILTTISHWLFPLGSILKWWWIFNNNFTLVKHTCTLFSCQCMLFSCECNYTFMCLVSKFYVNVP